MKRNQKWLALLTLIVSVCLLAGCLPVAWVSSYTDSEYYKVGNFTYSAKNVDSIYVHWYEGEIQFVESDKETLSVYENGTTLADEAKLHWYLNKGELRIEFCASEYSSPIASGEKHLVVELPKGVDLIVNDASADIKFGSHTFGELAVYSLSGNISLESVVADKTDIGTVSGQLELDNITAQKRARFITTSGPISVQKMDTKELELSSVGGSIAFQSLTASQSVEIETTSGALTVEELSTNEADLATVSGAIKIGLSRGKKLNVENNSGSVAITLGNGLGATVTGVSAKSLQKTYKTVGGKYVIGNGSCQIEIESPNGAVTIQ